MEIGYIRVSSTDQNESRQLDGIALEKTFTDKCSGKNADRPELKKCLDFVRDGDTLHVHSIDRMARNLFDLLRVLDMLKAKNVAVVFHKENMTFDGSDNPMQKLHLHVLGAVAEFERALIRERQREGIAIAKKKGVYKGGKRRASDEELSSVKKQVETHVSVTSLARQYKVSRSTIYRWIKEGGSQKEQRPS